MSDTETNDIGGVSGQQLRSFVDRIERLEEEKTGIADDIKDLYSVAKGQGFEVKVLRKIISLRKRSKEDRQEEEELMALYLTALGMDA